MIDLKYIIELISSMRLSSGVFYILIAFMRAFINNRILRKESKTFIEYLSKDIAISLKHLNNAYIIIPKGVIAAEWLIHPRVEEHLRRFFKDIVNEGDICIDIGANMGIHTLLLAKLVGDGMVIAIEPSPYTFNILVKNIEINKFTNVIPLDIACSNNISKEDFYYSTRFICWNTLEDFELKESKDLKADMSNFEIVQIQTKPLDHIINELHMDNKPIKVIKIDVEGHEVEVLKGSINTLKNTKYVVIETRDKTDKEVKDILVGMQFKLLKRYENHEKDTWYDNIFINTKV